MKNALLPIVTGIALTALTISVVRAQDTWNSPNGTVWNTAGNWQSSSVPASTDTVVLDRSNVVMPSTITLTSGATGANIQAGVLNIGSSNGPALTSMTIQASGTTATDTLTLASGSITVDSSLLGAVNIGTTPTTTGTILLTSSTNTVSITNNSSTQTLTLAAVVNGSNSLVLNSSGSTIVVSGANTGTGTVTVGNGSDNTAVQMGATNSLSSFTGGVTVNNGSAVDTAGLGTLTATNFTLNGSGFGSGIYNGALVNSTGTATDSGSITLGSNATIKNSGTGSLTLSGTVTIGTNTLTVDGTGTTTISGLISGSTGGLTKIGTGTLTLNGAAVNTYTGTTTVNGGTLVVNLGNLATPSNLINSSSALVLGGNTGGTLTITPKTSVSTSTQTFASTTINAGANAISTSGTLTVGLGAITRNQGGTVSFTLPSTGSITTTSSNTNGILGAWATVGNTAYATVNGSNAIASLTGTAITSGGSISSGTANYTSATTNLTLTGAAAANTIQYTGATGTLAEASNSLTVSGLMNSGSGVLTISGGTLAAPSGDLVLTGNNGFVITSGITSGNLVDSNSNTVTLSGVNTYNGATYVNSGVLNLNSSITGTGVFVANGATLTEGAAAVIGGTMPLYIGQNSTVTLNGANTYTGTTTLGNGSTLNINNAGALGSGTLVINGGTINNTSGGNLGTPTNNPAEIWNNSFTFTGGSSLNLGTGAVTLNFSPTVTVTSNTLTVGGAIGGNFGLTKAGAGALVLNGNNTYTGLTTASAGTLTLNGNNTGNGGVKLTGALLNIGNMGATGGGTVFLSSGSFDNTSGSSGTLTNNNNVDLAGALTFVGSNSLDLGTGTVAMSTTSTLTVTANTLELDGAFETTGTFSLTKAGAGTLLLTGGSSSTVAYQGSTAVSSGTLQITGGLDTNTGSWSVSSGATLDLNGAAGLALVTTGSITVGNGGTLLLDNRNGNEGGGTGGQQTGAPIQLNNGAHLIYQGSTTGDSVSQSSTIGLGSGVETITVTDNNSSGGSALLNITSGLSSGSTGIALINGVNLGTGSIGTSAGTNVPIVKVSSATTVGTTTGTNTINAGVDNTKIVPYLLGESATGTGGNGTATGTANTFLTYNSASGFRPLNPTQEFMNNSIATGDNTYITAATAATGSTSINSLVINGGNLNISNTGTVTDASGALLFVTSNSINGGTLAIGTAPTGTFTTYITTDQGVNATIGSAIGQTGTTTNVVNLNVYGFSGSSLDLTGASTYTGTTNVTGGAILMIGNNSALGTSLINGNSGTIEADNQARTIGNTVFNNNTPTTIAGSNALTFTGASSGAFFGGVSGIAFADANFDNTAMTISNTAPTTFSGAIALTSNSSGHNNSGNFFTLTSSADLVLSGNIVDNTSPTTPDSTGGSNALQINYSGATANATISNSTNNFNQGLSSSFTWISNSTSPAGFYTLTLSGGTPLGGGNIGSNNGNLLLVALTNNETMSNGFVATGGSINNFNYGLGFAGSNSMTVNSGTWGSTVNFLDIASSTATLTFAGGSTSAGINWGGWGNLDFGSTVTLTGGNFTHAGAGNLTISSLDSMTGTTTLNGGTTILDYSTNDNTKLSQNTAAASASQLILQSVALQLSGGSGSTYQQTLGTASSGVNGTTLNSGQTSVVDTNSGTTMLETGTITRNTGGVINIGSGAVSVANSNSAAGIIGGWATFGGTDWAVSNGATSAVTALGTYTTWPGGATGSSSANYLLSAGGASSTTGNFAANTLKFSTASGTLSLATTSTLTVTSGGGMLFTGAGNYGITSGTITTAGSDLIVNQFSTGTVTLGSVISGSEALTLAGGGAVVLTGANTYTGNTYLDGDLVQISADNNLGGSAGTIVLQGGTLDVTTSGYTSSRAISLGANGGTIEVDAGTLTESGVVSGGSNNTPVIFTKTGSGTLALTGNNTFYAQTNINGGTLMMGTSGASDNTALGPASTGADRSDSPLNVNGGTLDINGSTAALGVITLNGGSIIDSASVKGTLTGYSFNLESGTVGAALIDDIISGTTSDPIDLYKFTTGTVVLTGNNSYTGATQIDGGVLQIGNGGTSGTLGTANVTLNGALPVGVTVTAGSGTIAFDRSDSITVANAISGAGDVIQMGTGTLTLTGNNSYSGTTAINNGTLAVGTVSALSSSTVQPLGDTSGITLGVASTSSGVLRYTGSTATLTASITAQGNGGDTVQNAGTGTLTLSGGLTKNGTTLTLNAGTGGINVASVISGGASNSDMDFTGGTTVLSTAATYNGATWIYGSGVLVNGVSGGALPTNTSLNLGTPGADGVATSTVTTAATFDLDGNNQTVAGLNTEGTGGYTSDIVTNNGTSGTSTLTVSAGGTFAGIIQDGATAHSALALTGGVMNLSGANTYTGSTTVSSGTLNLTGSLASGSTVTVGGATGSAMLEGTGTVNGPLFTSASGTGIVAPGSVGTVGTLNVGNLGFTIGAGTNFDYDINTSTTAGGTSNDLIAMGGGTLTVGGTGIVFNFDQLSGLTTGTAYTLIDGASLISGFSASDFTATGDAGYAATFSISGGSLLVTFTSASPNYYYTGSTSNTFTDATNYYTAASGGTQQSGSLSSTSNVFLDATSPTPANTPDTLNGSASINSLTFLTANESLAGSGTVTLAATGTAGITDSAGVSGDTETVAPSVVLGSNQTWTATANSTLNVTGNVSGAQSLAVTGAGTVKLAGANTFSGLTIGTGSDTPTVLFTNTSGSASGTTTLTVNSGATIGGTGTSSGTSFNIAGTGTATGQRANVLVGMVSASDVNTTNTLTLLASGTSTITNANLTFNINAQVAGQGTELNIGSTALTFGSGVQSTTLTLNIENTGVITGSPLFVLIAGNTSGAVDQYSGLTLGAGVGNIATGLLTPILNSGVGQSGDLTLALTGLANSWYGAHSELFLYQNSTSGADDIEVEVVPEPSTYALILGGIAMLMYWQRKRRQNKV